MIFSDTTCTYSVSLLSPGYLNELRYVHVDYYSLSQAVSPAFNCAFSGGLRGLVGRDTTEMSHLQGIMITAGHFAA